MSEEQLKETILHLRLELDHEREERNYFQLERDKINTFWEITKKELPENCRHRSWKIGRQNSETRIVRWRSLRSAIRSRSRFTNKRCVQQLLIVRALIPTIVREQVKHLLYEHQNNVAQLKEAGRFRPFLRVLACTDEDASAGEMALKLQQEEHRQHEAESKRDKRSLKLELKELELAHEDAIRELKQVPTLVAVSYTHLRAHETLMNL
eukprot:679042-Prymnesium_polylepis.1